MADVGCDNDKFVAFQNLRWDELHLDAGMVQGYPLSAGAANSL